MLEELEESLLEVVEALALGLVDDVDAEDDEDEEEVVLVVDAE